jgi:hypothetical protein
MHADFAPGAESRIADADTSRIGVNLRNLRIE